MNAARVLREARRRAGLTQRDLATKAGVAQSQIARIELGHTVPRVDTLDALLEACGEGLFARRRYGEGVDRTVHDTILRMSVDQRLAQQQDAARFAYRFRGGLRRAGQAREDGPTVVEPVVEVLARHDLRYIVIGGIAATVHGSEMSTIDFDVCYARDPDNLERLAAALLEMDASLRGAPEGLPFVLDAVTLRNGMNFTFDTRFGAFDCLGQPAGVSGYEELEPNAVRAALGGRPVDVTSLEDLIRMKEAAGRPKDRWALEHLIPLQEDLDRNEGEAPR